MLTSAQVICENNSVIIQDFNITNTDISIKHKCFSIALALWGELCCLIALV